MAIHEHIARMVKKSWNATQWRYCGQPCGGSVDGRFVTGKRDISCRTEGVPGSFLLENLGYTFGFIMSLWPASNYLPKIP